MTCTMPVWSGGRTRTRRTSPSAGRASFSPRMCASTAAKPGEAPFPAFARVCAGEPSVDRKEAQAIMMRRCFGNHLAPACARIFFLELPRTETILADQERRAELDRKQSYSPSGIAAPAGEL